MMCLANGTKTGVLLLLILFSGMQLKAQQLLLKAGMNLARLEMQEEDEDQSSLLGVQAGLVMNLGQNGPYSFAPELLLSEKGIKYLHSYDQGQQAETWRSQLRLLYIELPLMSRLWIWRAGQNGLYLSAGPYLAMGLKGSYMVQISSKDEEIEEKIDVEWGKREGLIRLRRWDYGLRVGAGFQLSRFQLEAGFQQGLANIMPDELTEDRVNHQLFSFSVAYQLTH